MFSHRILLAPLMLALLACDLRAAEQPVVRELRTQRVGDTTYFHVYFEPPSAVNGHLPRLEPGPYTEAQRRRLARLPHLVPQDTKASAVYQRLEAPHYRPAVGFDETRAPVPVQGLEFVGKVREDGKATFLLLYPSGEESARPPDGKETDLTRLLRRATWAEVPVELDFSLAMQVANPRGSIKRKPHQAPTRDDLEGLWAEAQVARLAVLEALAPEFGFYGFACAATGRKYGVVDPVLEGERAKDREKAHRRLYEMTTGAGAIAQSLATERLLGSTYRDSGQRVVDIAKVPGIDIAEHPWEKMMAGKTPSPEPLAKLVPHDNYYIHFKNVRKFIEFGELLDQWGTNISRAYEVNSRDYQLKERYEKQLCIKSTWMGKKFGPAAIKSLAITGNDPYIREGSDITVLFHVNNRQLFYLGVDQFIDDARKEFGRELKESKSLYQDITIESYVTPLREVSTHRAAFGEFVVYSNSPVALRRVIDTHQGRHKCLWDSLDFQYMRTVFRLDDDQEDGFAFLSDAFIRQLVGPASKIKEKRRLEAMTSLYMVTHGAMFTAWETGRPPKDHEALLAAAQLRPEEIYVPEGKGIAWDARKQVAVSDVYNTFHFATPLIELPMDKITKAEEQEYLNFRREYLRLWQKFFDPVGMRFWFDDKQVRMDTYILPLINNAEYGELRRFAGDGTTKLDVTRFSPLSLGQFTAHISPESRKQLESISNWVARDERVKEGWVGDWFMLRLDDSAVYPKLVEFSVAKELDPNKRSPAWDEEIKFITQMPWTAGIGIKNKQEFEKVLAGLRKMLTESSAQGITSKPKGPPYKGIVITHVHLPAGMGFNSELDLYHALVDDGWYVSLSEDSIRDLIDRSVARRDGKEPIKKETVDTNGSLYVAPEAAFKASGALRSYLEWETHKRALPNTTVWYALQQSHAGFDDAAALKFLGFIPVSPDGSAYRYDARTGEVVNARHGSLRKPQLHPGIEEKSPIGQLLDQVRTLRVDLRFREDGVHTVLTIERKAK